ncbi:hypothetical protein [Sphingomonas sp.]|uniref:hypothetical protein n=1 Tax=Sphingomonas sp. TaxID=28214 RepID=UPI0038B13FF3
MSDDADPQDYSSMKGVADEPHWNAFVPTVGGQLVAPLIKRQGVKNADYLFPAARVVAELKVLETEFAHTPEMLAKVDHVAAKYPGEHPDDPTTPLRGELIKLLRAPLQRIINKANRQIKETKQELGLVGWRGILIIVNDSFRGLPPGMVMGLIANVLAGQSYSSTDAFIYQTNHCVELPDNPYAVYLWAPLYSDRATDDLVEFINNLGRSWRNYFEAIAGPFDYSAEQESADLANALVVTGPFRHRRYDGD